MIENEKQEESSLEIKSFISTVVMPAFEELKSELENDRQEVRIFRFDDSVTLEVKPNSDNEYIYRIEFRFNKPIPFTRFREKRSNKLIESQSSIRSGSQDYTMSDITKEEIISHFFSGYKRHNSSPS
jgi:hypothetical protein